MGGGVRDRGAKTWGRKKRLVRIRVAGLREVWFLGWVFICVDMLGDDAMGRARL